MKECKLYRGAIKFEISENPGVHHRECQILGLSFRGTRNDKPTLDKQAAETMIKARTPN